MKSPRIRHIIWLLLLWLMPGSFVVMGQNVNGESAQEAENVQDTIAPRYSVRKTVPGTLKDLSPHPADLQSPMNLRTEAEYDAKTDKYYIRTKLGNTEIGVPMILTPEEYLDWTLKQSMQSYYRQKNRPTSKAFMKSSSISHASSSPNSFFLNWSINLSF